jgi:DNA-binding PadR family transcriptional regulator
VSTIRLTDSEAAVLGLLYRQPLHGYEIEKVIAQKGMRHWTVIGFSSIYYVLKRLERNTMVSSRIEQGEPGKPARKIYHITEVGRLTMKQRVRELLSEYVKPIAPFDLGMAFSDLLESDEMRECLRVYRTTLTDRARFLEEQLEKRVVKKHKRRYIAHFERHRAFVRAELAWLDGFIGHEDEPATDRI